MAAQDRSGGTNPKTIATADNCMFLDVGSQSITGVQLEEIYSSGDDHAPKARKPYTITKHRERWTEDEHKKFLEALKLYGRAWRRIEEHVGTKTAVQIRSHAQKFFSKVVQKSSSSNGGSEKPIVIPPPRPKRKPMHPYPRKLVNSLKKGISVLGQPERPLSRNLSASIQENQSPTSALSTFGSDTLDSTTLNPHNNSLSPVSSYEGVINPVSLLLSEKVNGSMTPASSTEEENGSPSSVLVTPGSFQVDQSSMKSDPDSQDNVCSTEDLAVEAPTTTLKLFGRTILVTDSHRPPSSTVGTQKTFQSESHQENLDMNEEKPVQTLPWNTTHTEFSLGATKGCSSPCPWPCGAPPVFYMQLQKEDPNLGSTAALPGWALYGGFSFPLVPTHTHISTQMTPDSCLEEVQEGKEIQKEGSSMGSSTASVSEVGNGDKNWDVVESQSHSEQRANPDKFMKGFIPYKRCLAERETQSSAIVREERDAQRIRLCL
ncbi:hypothetical protein HHK36_006649 [Tetracentron sinense]|uniref:Uncharacterized protein n=1 Tax=Tetracentron sinense TaxID=13715 RepID=A0A834ZLB4_TETSI|nr:hypothetical protein HHK36_006649 [Tetracentron sinense]